MNLKTDGMDIDETMTSFLDLWTDWNKIWNFHVLVVRSFIIEERK
jgi:hypothetical protein